MICIIVKWAIWHNEYFYLWYFYNILMILGLVVFLQCGFSTLTH